MFGFIKYIFVVTGFFIGILVYLINFSTPPQLRQQIDVKTMSVIKLHSYVDNYKSDNEPSGSSWGRGTYGGK